MYTNHCFPIIENNINLFWCLILFIFVKKFIILFNFIVINNLNCGEFGWKILLVVNNILLVSNFHFDIQMNNICLIKYMFA